MASIRSLQRAKSAKRMGTVESATKFVPKKMINDSSLESFHSRTNYDTNTLTKMNGTTDLSTTFNRTTIHEMPKQWKQRPITAMPKVKRRNASPMCIEPLLMSNNIVSLSKQIKSNTNFRRTKNNSTKKLMDELHEVDSISELKLLEPL